MAENKDGQYGIDRDLINLLVNNPLEGYFKLPELSTLSDDVSLKQATEVKIGQILMQKALDEGNEDACIEAIGNRMMEGKNSEKQVEWLKQESPLKVESELSADMQKIYAQYYKDIEDLIHPSKGREILKEAGYSVAEMNKLPFEFTRHIAVSALHDKTFDSQNPDIVARAREAKPSVIDAISNSKALSYLGLAVGCATGGIVLKAGMSGAGFLLSKLGENPKVAKLSQSLKDKATAFVCKKLNISPERMKEKTESFFSSRAFRGAALVATGVAIGVGIFVGMDNYEQAGEFLATIGENFKDGTGLPTGDNYGLAGSLGTPVESVSTVVADNGVSNAVSDNVPKSDLGGAMGFSSLNDLVRDATSAASGVDGDYNASTVQLTIPSHSEGIIYETTTDGLPASEDAILTEEVTLSQHTVQDGESLWKISEAHLQSQGIDPTDGQINTLKDQIYDANKALIGDNPDLIYPGQEFTIPATEYVPEIAAVASEPDQVSSASEGLDNSESEASIPVTDTSKLASGDLPESDDIDESILKAKVSKDSNIGMNI